MRPTLLITRRSLVLVASGSALGSAMPSLARADDAPSGAYGVRLKAGSVSLTWTPQDPRAFIKLWPADPAKDATLANNVTTWNYTAAQDETLYFAVYQGGSGILVTTVDPTSTDPNNGVLTTTATSQGWALLTFTNTPGPSIPSRTLISAQVDFQSPFGDDDSGKDHDTEMDVELYDKNGTRVAYYIEADHWVAGSAVPSTGANFPQGYAPNTDVKRDMQMLSNASEANLRGGSLSIKWEPKARGPIGRGHDKWNVDIHLIMSWNTNEQTVTKAVRYGIGGDSGTYSNPISWP